MERIRRDGRILESSIEVKNEIARFYEDLYKGESVKRPKFDGLCFPKIPDEVIFGWRESLRMSIGHWRNAMGTKPQVQMVLISLSLKLDEIFFRTISETCFLSFIQGPE